MLVNVTQRVAAGTSVILGGRKSNGNGNGTAAAVAAAAATATTNKSYEIKSQTRASSE